MKKHKLSVLLDPLKSKIKFLEPMKKHTSLKVGGPAEIYFQPSDLDELSFFLSNMDKDIPIFWLGRGSNILVRDGGISGIVISSSLISKQIEKIDNNSIEVGANVPCTMLAKQCIRWGMAPSEFFSGIPGSIGGALAMNAGAYGNETWERVDSVKSIDRLGEYHTRKPSEYKINYRSVVGPPDEWFISAKLIFDPDKSSSMETQKEMLNKRKISQPLGKPSCGSVFRNPEGNFAAKLIQDSGLKGFRIGGAQISKKHANFIINDQKASAEDIERLINHIQKKIFEKFDIQLECEVKIIGNL